MKSLNSNQKSPQKTDNFGSVNAKQVKKKPVHLTKPTNDRNLGLLLSNGKQNSTSSNDFLPEISLPSLLQKKRVMTENQSQVQQESQKKKRIYDLGNVNKESVLSIFMRG